LDVTEHIKPPRAVFLPFMMGHHFGVPHHKKLQRRVILSALEMLENVGQSGEVRRFPMTWAQARREGREIERDGIS
jgi:hypothetical protein